MTEELIRVDVPWNVDYRISAGNYGSRFLTHVRDEGKFLAAKCPKCQRWFLPPTIACSICRVHISDYPEGWVEMSGKGYLVSWSKVVTPMMNIYGELKAHPYLIGQMRLDEGPSFGYYINVVPDSEEEAKLKKGLRVEIEMQPKEKRKGVMEIDGDIKYIKILWDEPINEDLINQPSKQGISM